jgi:beta-lactamase class A
MSSKKQNSRSTTYQSYHYGSQSANPNYQANNRPNMVPKAKRKKGFFIWLIVIVLAAFVGHTIWANHVAAHERAIEIQDAKIKAEHIAEFTSTTQSIINNNPQIDFDVSVVDLSNNKQTHFGEDSPMDVASVGKIITAVYFMKQVEAGNEKLSETINGSTAQYELQQMIVVSDDDAWGALNSELGYQGLQSYANSLGISDYSAVNNTLTSGDIAEVLTKLYEGKLLDQTDTQLILGYMKQANYRGYIVPAVPSSDTIYHKIGLLNDIVNDAAIITNGKQSFVLVIFTNGNGVYNWPARAVDMQQIATSAINAYLGN